MTTPPLAAPQVSRSLISVIIPTYNRAASLHRALQSVLAQDMENFEVIVIDDGSIDSTSLILEANQDPRLLWIHHAMRQGAAAARNTGIRASRGKWLAFLDSDDEWLPGMLRTMMNIAQQCDARVGVVYGSFEHHTGNRIHLVPGWLRRRLSRLPFKRYRLSGDLRFTLQRGNFITLQTAVIRRECFETIGYFDETLPRLQDWEFWLRLCRSYDFTWVNQKVARVKASSDSISSSTQALIKALEIIKQAHAHGMPELNAHLHFILGDLSMKEGATSQGQTNLWLAVRSSPLTLVYWLAILCAVMAPASYRKLSSQLSWGYAPE